MLPGGCKACRRSLDFRSKALKDVKNDYSSNDSSLALTKLDDKEFMNQIYMLNDILYCPVESVLDLSYSVLAKASVRLGNQFWKLR